MKKNFLIVYNYGTGGAWGVMLANRKDDISDKYPFLQVIDEPPSWMTADMYNDFLHRAFDIDSTPSGWLADAISEQ